MKAVGEKVVMVVPVYNERENIAPFLLDMEKVASSLPAVFTILFVEGGSSDGTGDAVDEAAVRLPNLVSVLHEEKKEGLGAAYLKGFARALDDPDALFIGEMDVDGSHDPDVLPKLLKAVQKGYGMALGSRAVEGGGTPDWPIHRRMISGGANLLGRAGSAFSIGDVTTGYRLYRREVLDDIDLGAIETRGYAFQLEMVAAVLNAEFTVAEIPLVFHDRERGASKLRSNDIIEYFLLSLRLIVRRILGRK
ncbi:MAG: polyprenol monophosphomannose synthase [Candidatus Undinarchaeales archaeon]|jgi:dolichol-phosphate mannosyltransferase|nr:polyprenol monophosphomannose synthase [Candidatus Undinarchaeales archaeon]MDP7491970.1 polyprenol monophosphomannose synthase [Candidatus Undinarchaeales archaeon]